MKLSDQVFVVTGAGSGIGRSLTIELLNQGAGVAMVDYNESSLKESLKSLSEALHTKVSIHVTDISKGDQVSELPEKILKHHGRIDGIINNAGIIQPFEPIENLDLFTMERIININWWGTIYMIHYFLPLLKARPKGYIVNVASMGGFISFPGQTVYSSSKAAVKILTEGLHSELASTNVHVTLALPGAVNTNIMRNSGIEFSQNEPDDGTKTKIPMLSSARAAQIIIQAMINQKFRVLVGRDSWILDKLYRLNPAWATGFIAKQMSKK